MNASLQVLNEMVSLKLLDPSAYPISCGRRQAPGLPSLGDAGMVIHRARVCAKASGQRIASFRITRCKKCQFHHVTLRLVGERKWRVA